MPGVMDPGWLADATAAVAACGHMAEEKSDVALTHFTEDGRWPARSQGERDRGLRGLT